MLIDLLMLALALPPCRLARARPEMVRALQTASGSAGAAVVELETGCSVSVRGDARFPMQSVYKLPIAMAVLRRIDADQVKLSQVVHVGRSDMVPMVYSPLRDQNPGGTDATVRELLRDAIVDSDGTASDMLLHLTSPDSVTLVVHRLGVDSMMIATTERTMAADVRAQYRNWTTPRAAGRLLAVLQSGRGVSAPSRALLLGWLTETTRGDKRIKGGVPAGTVVAHKTGTDGTHNGLTRATNDIGLVTLPNGHHLAIAVFIRDSRAPDAARDAMIAHVTHITWTAMTRKGTR